MPNLPKSGVIGRVFCVAVLCLAGNCAPASVALVRPSRADSERIVAPKDFGGVVNVRRGDVLVVRPPMAATEWQVMFDESHLEFQGDADNLRSPGPDGWRFKVVGAGETSLTVSPVSRGANPPRFSVTVHVDP